VVIRSKQFSFHLSLLLERIQTKMEALEPHQVEEREQLLAAEQRVIDLINRYHERRENPR
jgi:hypothetical protein